VTSGPVTGAKVIRPFEADSLRSPTMRELEAAERTAIQLGDMRRALAYRTVRMRRLRLAQRGKP
jgi:hypothetical protein